MDRIIETEIMKLAPFLMAEIIVVIAEYHVLRNIYSETQDVERNKSHMNIIYVTGIFAENRKLETLGGMAGYIFKVANYLKKEGHNTIIIAAGGVNKVWYYNGIEIHTVEVDNIFTRENIVSLSLKILYRDFCLQKEIKKVCSKNHIDLIQYTGWFGVGVLHKKGIPAILRISSYTKTQLVFTKKKNEVLVNSFFERLAAKNKNGIIAPSFVMGKAFEKDIKRKVHIIETPFWDELHGEYDNSICNNELKNKNYFLFFGRLSKDKGIEVIANILDRVLTMHPDCFFVFAGWIEIDENVGIKNRIYQKANLNKNRVIFLGNIPHEKLYPVIMNAQAILMPSLMDNFPNACAEAMYFGKIVIGTDGSSLEQFIEDGVNGLLAELNDADSLYNKIEQFYALNHSEKEGMSIHARDRIKCLRPKIAIGKLLNYYKHIIAAQVKPYK